MRLLLNGEEVIFNGTAPETMGELYKVVNGYVESDQRCLVEFSVDGLPLHQSQLETLTQSFNEVRATAVSLETFMLQLAQEQIRVLPPKIKAIEDFSLGILSVPFSKTVASLEKLMRELTPHLEAVGQLSAYDDRLSVPLNASLDTLNMIIDHAGHRDVALMHSVLSDHLVPQLKKIIKILT